VAVGAVELHVHVVSIADFDDRKSLARVLRLALGVVLGGEREGKVSLEPLARGLRDCLLPSNITSGNVMNVGGRLKMLRRVQMAVHKRRNLVLVEQRHDVLDEVRTGAIARVDLVVREDNLPLGRALLQLRLEPSQLLRVLLSDFENAFQLGKAVIERRRVEHEQVGSERANLLVDLVVKAREVPALALLRVLNLSLLIVHVVVVSSDDIPFVLEELVLEHILVDFFPFRIVHGADTEGAFAVVSAIEIVADGEDELGLGGD